MTVRTADTNTSYYDADRGHVGHSYSNQWGEGSHFMLVAIDTTGDVTGTQDAEYIQEFARASMYLKMAM